MLMPLLKTIGKVLILLPISFKTFLYGEQIMNQTLISVII